jgi:hypothetical protein
MAMSFVYPEKEISNNPKKRGGDLFFCWKRQSKIYPWNLEVLDTHVTKGAKNKTTIVGRAKFLFFFFFPEYKFVTDFLVCIFVWLIIWNKFKNNSVFYKTDITFDLFKKDMACSARHPKGKNPDKGRSPFCLLCCFFLAWVCNHPLFWNVKNEKILP